MSIRPANVRDVQEIARIHASRFPTQFVGGLPYSLIARFYATQLPHTILLVHEEKGGIDGFVHGGDPRLMADARKEFLLANLGRCLWNIVLQPHFLWSAIKFKILKRFIGPPPEDTPEDCCLRCIAVAQAAEGKGVGIALIEAFESAVRDQHSEYHLSVYKDNLQAIRLYEKLDFERRREVATGIVFVKRLKQDGSNKTARIADHETRNGTPPLAWAETPQEEEEKNERT